ncbi:MAG: type II secretion system F family protein [Candidatus Woesearchaeota archaeon]
MQIIRRLYGSLIHILPRDLQHKFLFLGRVSGYEQTWRHIVGNSVLGGLLLAVVCWSFGYFNTIPAVVNWVWYLLAVLSMLGGYVGSYIFLFFSAERRTARVERVLPDALQVIAVNLRAGSTPYEAVKAIADDQFMDLGFEMQRVINKVSGNVSFGDVLLTVNEYIDSPALHRCLLLFVSSIKSGGKLAELLEGLAVDITQRQSLKKDLVINTKTNSMFIMFTIVVGAPLLMAISIYFVDIVADLQENTGSTATMAGFGGGELLITSGFLLVVAYVFLLLTAVFACLFVGAMIDGEAKRGLKYAPMVIGATYAVFFVARFLIVYFFG